VPDGKARILHLIKGLGRGGAETLLLEGLRVANRDTFDFEYAYFLEHKDDLAAPLRELGAEVHCFGAQSTATIAVRLPRAIRFLAKNRFDLIHAHLPVTGVIARALGLLTRTPVVYSEHYILEKYHPITKLANTVTYPLQRAVIAVSGQVRESIADNVPFRVPTQVVQNGVSLGRFQRESFADEDRVDDSITVGTVAVFRRQKRLDTWLKAAQLIHEKAPSTRFVVVGDGPERDELEAVRHALGLDSVVEFAGLHSDVRPYLAQFDIFMMSSEGEGQPVALLEAMAMKCTPVVTAVGGIPELVEDGVSGKLVNGVDEKALAAAVLELAGDADALQRMGQSAHETVRIRFSIEAMQLELETLYKRVLNRHD
jgi:glycosyltransferase involved in cell wall biosynthesis